MSKRYWIDTMEHSGSNHNGPSHRYTAWDIPKQGPRIIEVVPHKDMVHELANYASEKVDDLQLICGQINKIEQLEKDLVASRAEIEELMKVDYWQDRHNIVVKKLDSALAAIGHLREAGQGALDYLIHATPAPGCHCPLCEFAHAMSATSGYKTKTEGVKNEHDSNSAPTNTSVLPEHGRAPNSGE